MQSERLIFPLRTTGNYIIACIETTMGSPTGLSQSSHILGYLNHPQPKEWKKELLYFMVWVEHICSWKVNAQAFSNGESESTTQGACQHWHQKAVGQKMMKKWERWTPRQQVCIPWFITLHVTDFRGHHWSSQQSCTGCNSGSQ